MVNNQVCQLKVIHFPEQLKTVSVGFKVCLVLNYHNFALLVQLIDLDCVQTLLVVLQYFNLKLNVLAFLSQLNIFLKIVLHHDSEKESFGKVIH